MASIKKNKATTGAQTSKTLSTGVKKNSKTKQSNATCINNTTTLELCKKQISYLIDESKIINHQNEETEKICKITIERLIAITQDEEVARELERGIFEATINDYNDENINYKSVDFNVIYLDKLNNIFNFVNQESYANLVSHYVNGILHPYLIPFLTSVQLSLVTGFDYSEFVSELNLKSETDPIQKLSLMTNIGKRLVPVYERNISVEQRMNVVIKFIKLLGEISAAIKLEYGILENSILYSTENKYEDCLIESIYEEKCNELVELFDSESRLHSASLTNKVSNNVLDFQGVSFLSPYELNEENWKEIKEKINYKHHIRNTHETTDLYKCPKCEKRKATVMLLQTRGADEPITTFITCQHCGFQRKK
jgi:DNA-directed RNA polymerase subunit M/transcription elongation factor TFIIS